MKRLRFRVELLALAFWGVGCMSEGSEPNDDPALHNRLVFELLGELGVMAPDGSQRQTIPRGDDISMAMEPVVSPDGKRVAFTGQNTEGWWDLYVMQVDGSERRQLTSGHGQVHTPAWSPDGDSLSFTWTPVDPPGDVVLTVIAADGTGRRELVRWGAGGQWSPDGQRVMFYGFGPFPAGIYVTDPAGLNVSRLDKVCGPHDCTDSGVRWSPDGEFITFNRSFDGAGQAVGIMRADGSDARLLLPPLDTFGGIWSPDGSQVVLNGLTETPGITSTYVLTVATGDTIRLPSTYEFVTDWTD